FSRFTSPPPSATSTLSLHDALPILPAVFLLMWGSWNARAQSLAFVLFVAVVWLLIADARAPSRRILFVFPLLALWANIHGTAITDRKSTRLNSSHGSISYAVFCLKK